MKNFFKIIGVGGLVLFLSSTAFGKTVPAAFRSDIRALGMGGAFVAAGDRAGAMFYNPALLSKVGFDLAIPSMRLELNDDFLDIVDFAVDNQENFANFDSLSDEEAKKFYDDAASFDDQWVKTRITPMLNLALLHFGVATYNVTDVKVKIDRGVYNPRVYGDVVSDLVIAAGYARGVPVTGLTVGAVGKFISRRTTELIKISASDLGSAEDIGQSALDSLQSAETGFGLDIGCLWKASPALDVGVVLQDLVGGVGGEKFPINLKAGIAYRPLAVIPAFPFAKSILLAADVEDGFNYDGDSLFNKVHLGAQLKIPFFPLTFRGGFNQGYPTFGLGLNLLILKIDYAYYSEELGDVPGAEQETNHAVQLKLGW